MTRHQLVAFALGELSAAEAAAVQAHLLEHATDAQFVADVRRTVETMRRDDSTLPPPGVIAKAKAIFGSGHCPVERPSWLDQLSHVIAELVFNSRSQPALVGLRGPEDSLQLSYSAGTVEVDLQIESVTPGGRRWQIIGQVTTDEAPSATAVALIPRGARIPAAVAVSDAHGVFSLDAMPGTYELAIRLPDRVVLLPDIEIE
jgi:anti-sigma factor RsiW